MESRRFIDRGKDVVSRQRDQLNAAVEAGRSAYREVIGGPGEASGQPLGQTESATPAEGIDSSDS